MRVLLALFWADQAAERGQPLGCASEGPGQTGEEDPGSRGWAHALCKPPDKARSARWQEVQMQADLQTSHLPNKLI